LNPTDLDVTDVNCDEVLTNYDEILKSKKDIHWYDFFTCLRFKTEGILDRGVFWRLFVLATSNIPSESKKSEKENYVNIFEQIDLSHFKECIQSVSIL
jgi:hypothetical protein